MRKRRMLGGLFAGLLLAGVHTGMIAAETEKEEYLQEVAEQIVQGSNELGNYLTAKLSAEGDNVFISPYGISMALSMLSSCSENGTHVDELRLFLGYEGLTDEEIRNGHGWLIEEMKSESMYEDYSEEEKEEQGIGIVEIANALYLSDRLDLIADQDELEELFLEYQAEVGIKPLDTEETMQEINEWVSEKTHEMIKSLLDEPMSQDTLMMLMNTIYFKGYWVNDFDERDTDTQIFYAPEQEIEVDMMHQTDYFSYAETEDYQIIHLPYHRGYQMQIYLPKDQHVYEQWSNVEHWEALHKEKYDLEYAKVALSLPKFEMEFGAELTGLLQDMGLKGIFDASLYDRISNDGLQTSCIIHKTALSNDEYGTEAAAVTAIMLAGGAMVPEQTVEMVVDRPFYFTITDYKNGVNLFEGCVFYPES